MSGPTKATPKPWPVPTAELHEAIRLRAEEVYIRNGRIAGCDLENWAQAEHEILTESAASTRRVAVVVSVNGVQYVGEYNPQSADGYLAGEFAAGAPVPVRFDGNKMFVRRPNGRELETTVASKIG